MGHLEARKGNSFHTFNPNVKVRATSLDPYGNTQIVIDMHIGAESSMVSSFYMTARDACSLAAALNSAADYYNAETKRLRGQS